MTTLKGPLSGIGDGSPDVGAQPGPPADSAVIDVVAPPAEPPAPEVAAAEPPASILPVVMPAHADASNALDYIRIVSADVVYETSPAPLAAPQPASSAAPLPVVLPVPSDGASFLDFVRVVRAEVVREQPVAPSPAAEPEPPPPHVQPIAAAVASPAMAVAPAPAPVVPTFELLPPTGQAPVTDPPVTQSTRPAWRRWVRRAALTIAGLAFGYAALVLALIFAYRTFDPPLSTLMLELKMRGEEIDYRPVPLTRISSYLQRAVVTSEDARFCRHGGVDWGALAEAMQDSRGGSTITMQTAKNLFLWPSRSYIRKAIEIPVALSIDFAWPKRRVLEVYLNIAEWGPGIFGAEAAAQYHFNKPASRLTAHEAALLAASLPNPIAREAGEPSRITALLASRLRARMAHSDSYVGCLGLRPTPRAEPPRTTPRTNPPTAQKAPPKPAPNAAQWQTKTTRTEPPKPAPPPAFNPWQN